MTNEEIKTTFLGQTVSKYDGWNGSDETILVNKVEVRDNCVVLHGERGNRNYDPCISFNIGIVEQLILTGKYVSHQEIDHCPYDVTIQILPADEQKFQRRIENLKADIKRLKQELKQAQKDYENYLVSIVRLEVIRNNNELNK